MKNVKTVWCEGAVGFAHCGNVFKAKVLDDSVMHRPARKGYVWVERITTPADSEVEVDEKGNVISGRVGPGAIVDSKFDTTDVLIVLNSKKILKKYAQLSFEKIH